MFLVPALNEEVTIGDSVRRLLDVEVPNKIVLVIDDGSEDGTADVLAAIEAPELEVLRRVAPDARNGKAAALNAGWTHLEAVLARRFAGWTRDRIVVAIVDADGRLDPGLRHGMSPHTSATPRSAGSRSWSASTTADRC